MMAFTVFINFEPCSVIEELIGLRSGTILDKNDKGNTPIHLACLNGHHLAAEVLIKKYYDYQEKLVYTFFNYR